MRARLITVISSALGIILIAVSVVAFDPQSQPSTAEALDRPNPKPPYANAEWVQLGHLIPADAAAADVYVRLILIEGAVLLPVDHDR